MKSHPSNTDSGPQPNEPPARADAETWLAWHGDTLFRFARARVGRREVAEDLVQETFLAAFEARDRFEGRSTELTWLLGILRRKVADHYRRADAGRAASPSPREPLRFFDEEGHWLRAPSAWKTPLEALLDGEFRSVLDGCLGRLPAHLAEAFLLRECENLGVETAGEALEVSPGNLRVRLHRARLLLRDCLETKGFGKGEDGDDGGGETASPAGSSGAS